MARTILISFLVGTLVGVSLTLGVIYLARQEAPSDQPAATNAGLIDDLITQWTSERAYGYLTAGEAHRTEPSNARFGFFPDTVRSLARIVDSIYRVPKGVVLAQWALESRFGLSALGGYNYFGHTYLAVKPFMSLPDFVTLREKVITPDGRMSAGRVVRFARYSSMRECFETHGRYLNGSPMYRRAFEQASPELFAQSIAASYATDPDYGLKLVVIMKRYQL